MRKIIALVLFILLLMPVCFADSYPLMQGTVTDLANVLGTQTATDIAELSTRLSTQTGSSLYVVTRHFLGGADTKAYARELFGRWGLTQNDALLLMVIGEDSYALVLGDALQSIMPAEVQSTTLSTTFRTPYLNRQYDQAVAGLSLKLVEQISRSYNTTVSSAGLLGQTALQSTPAPQTYNSNSWSSFFGSDFWQSGSTYSYESSNDIYIQQYEKSKSSSGIGIWQIIFLLILFNVVRKKARKSSIRKAARGRGFGGRSRW